MRCIYCGKDSDYQTRMVKRLCGWCGHKFAFEPQTDTLTITDRFFQRTIQNVSDEDAVFFTKRQLWYEFNRRLWRKRLSKVIIGWIIAFIGTILVSILSRGIDNSVSWPFIIVVLIAVLGITHYLTRLFAPRHPSVAFDQSYTNFHHYLERWEAAHGKIIKLLRYYG